MVSGVEGMNTRPSLAFTTGGVVGPTAVLSAWSSWTRLTGTRVGLLAGFLAGVTVHVVSGLRGMQAWR